MTDLSHLADPTACSEEDCDAHIEYAIFQNTPLVKCPKMGGVEIFLQGQRVEDQEYVDGLHCPLVEKLQGNANPST